MNFIFQFKDTCADLIKKQDSIVDFRNKPTVMYLCLIENKMVNIS